MIAILLNSGVGSRMGLLTADSPKAMVELEPGVTILSRQLSLLRAAGIREFVITTGFAAEKLQAHAQSCCPDQGLRFIHNERYRETNYIVSLQRAIEATRDDVVLLHGDLVFSAKALGLLLGTPGSVVAVDAAAPLPPKDFKARLAPDGRVKQIGVDVAGTGCVACQPLYKLTKEDWRLWTDAIEAFCQRGDQRVYAENALNTVTDRLNLRAVDMAGALCMEVDNEEDLAVARQALSKEKP